LGEILVQTKAESIVMQQVFLRKPKLNNLDNKRWSTPLLESHQDQQEQPSNQSTSVSLLTNKLGISREKAFVDIAI